ncbi:hypothetical protein A2335_04005 [Candidatus Peregrinibacteria bacterium RIFOXYB2_FULL_32_7]|nr:MAG: hypothetical protein A2335_04005 [Candidatus Peregrinibacteria bacterium RIFOXYB2_FULL_32_7]
MLKIILIQIGKTKLEYLGLEKEFLKRLQIFANIEIKTFPEAKTNEPEKNKQIEAEQILRHLDNQGFIVALDEHGEEKDSKELAKFIEKQKNSGLGKITFIIGGPFGIHKSIQTHCNASLSLSKMTFTHQMIRIIFLEQLYRAFTIITGKRYHY